MSNYAYDQDASEPETVAKPEPEDLYWQDMHEFIAGQQGDDN